jgi:TPR repeat protein
MTYQNDVFKAAQIVAALSKDGRFRPKQIKSYLIAEGIGCDPKTIQNELQRGCINGSKDWAKMYSRYERTSWGVYRLV